VLAFAIDYARQSQIAALKVTRAGP